MKIIQATIDHLDQLVTLFDGYRVFYKQSSDKKKAKQFLKDRLINEDSIIFMAFDDESNALGFTQLYPIFSSVSMRPLHVLNDLFVDTTIRGNGVGQALLEHAKDFIIKKNGKGLILETAKDNPAQYLYERHGWKLDSGTLHYTWENKNKN
jgi:GNAT superfamily N-acetyltransferase